VVEIVLGLEGRAAAVEIIGIVRVDLDRQAIVADRAVEVLLVELGAGAEVVGVARLFWVSSITASQSLMVSSTALAFCSFMQRAAARSGAPLEATAASCGAGEAAEAWALAAAGARDSRGAVKAVSLADGGAATGAGEATTAGAGRCGEAGAADARDCAAACGTTSCVGVVDDVE
jgi:hypothetical protein